MKAYLLTDGYYSGYGVLAVFSTREAAEAFLARYQGGDNVQIEECELDPGVLHLRDGYYRFCVKMDLHSGDVLGEPFEQYPGADDVGTVVELDTSPPRAEFQWSPMEEWIPTITVSCWARDIDHAVKIASEQRRAILVCPL